MRPKIEAAIHLLDDPTVLFTVLASPFIGSFLGVVIERVPARRPFLWARSECESCHHPLDALDLIPFASWAMAGGRCRHCGVRLSVFYPLVELAALVISVWAATAAEGWRFILVCVLGWALFTAAAIDWRKRRRALVPLAALAVWLACLYLVFRQSGT